MHGALPSAYLHLKALADVEHRVHNGVMGEVITKVRETRLAVLLAHILMIPIYFWLIPYFTAFIPTSLFHGLFLFMAISSLTGNEMWQRIMLLFTEQRSYPATSYLRKVSQRKVHAFTIIEILQLATLLAGNQFPPPTAYELIPRLRCKRHVPMQNTPSPSDDCPYDLWDEQTVFEGRWLKTRQIRFRERHTKQEGIWQSAHRTTKPANCEVDGVDIIAVLYKDNKKYFVLVKQYRIPMGGWCLEFPAGLIDEGETVEEAALRELTEETGYTATKVLNRSSGIQGLDPGLSDDSVQFVTVEIDGTDPRNTNPSQNLQSEEAIEVLLVECDKILDFMKANEKNLHIEAMVYTFAIGYDLAQRIKF
ncbi:unnamed protein product, partial [Mesorhabditis spiculigera]